MSNKQLQDLSLNLIDRFADSSEPRLLTKTLYTLCERLDRLEGRMDQANRMIAQNMFAIVRLEIANSSDAITNAILEVKHEKTGSGNAQLVMNVTGTLVMIAGNVLSGGGMSALGAVLVAGGTAVMAAANNDKMAFVSALVSGGATGAVASADGQRVTGGFSLLSNGDDPAAPTAAEKRANVGNASADGLAKIVDLVRAPKEEPIATFTLKYQRTAFIPHGAGGTSAITQDVQSAIVNAYHEVMLLLSGEIDRAASGEDIQGLPGSLIDEISKSYNPHAASDMTSNLHPLTKHVLRNALSSLSEGKGQYFSLQPAFLGNTVEAQAFVKRGYKALLDRLLADEPIPNGPTLVSSILGR
jgi:hypothetical protein